MILKIRMFINNNKIINNIFNMGVLKLINIFSNFILVGIIYRYLGNQELNGIWLTIFSILSWITLCDFGMGNGLRNKLTELLVRSDYYNAKKYISTTYTFMLVPVIIIIIFSIIVTYVVNWNNIFNLQTIVLSDGYLIKFIIMVIGLYVIRFYLLIINSIFYALFKNYIVTLMQTIDNFFHILIILLLIVLGYDDLLLLGFIYGIVPIITLSIFTHILFSKYMPQLKPSFKHFNIDILKEIGGIGLKFLVLQIAIIILFTTDNFIISRFLGVKEVTPYQLTNKLLGIFKIVLGIVLTNIWGIIIEYRTKKQYDKINSVNKRIFIVYAFLSILTIIIGLLIKPIIRIWIGSEIIISSNLIILMVIYNVIHMWCDIFQNILNGLNKLNAQVITYGLAALINIPISVFLVKITNLGVGGVIFGTIISLIIPAIILPLVLTTYFKKEI